MREIKFRFWNKITSEWEDDFFVCLWNGGVYNVRAMLEGNITYIIPCQYTGRDDKNGKEIFEGDIMYNKYPDRVEENGYGEDFAEIAFKDGSFGWIGSITGKFHSFAEEPLEDYEIVGNIYENADLLKKKI